MTAAQIEPIPMHIFVTPYLPAREHPDQRYLVDAVRTLRQAVRKFEEGDLTEFLLLLKRSSFLIGINPEWRTPSAGRVMSAISRVAMAAAERMQILPGRGGR